MVCALARIIAIAIMIARRGVKSWFSYATSALLNLWLMFMFAAFGIQRVALHVLVGAIIYTLFSSCMLSVVYDAYYEAIKLRELFLASPLSRIEFLLGISLGHMMAATIMSIPYEAILAYLRPTPLIVLVYVFIALSSWIVATCIGYLIPSRDPFTVGPKASLIASLMTLLPPVYYPDTLLPSQARYLLAAIPTYSIAKISKVLLGIERGSAAILVLCALLLTIEMLALLWVAIRRVHED